MNEYNKEQIKKETEYEALMYFLEAYEEITGQVLAAVEKSERPDFICCKQNGIKVGIELVQVRRGHPNRVFIDKYIYKQEYMSPEDAIEILQMEVVKKEKKRNERDWKLPLSSILLIELPEIPLSNIVNRISPNNTPDIYSTGFTEVWIVDFTGIEAYGNVELLCVTPQMTMGYYRRDIQKSYG